MVLQWMPERVTVFLVLRGGGGGGVVSEPDP